jgi:nucleotide-binding universal stress UspA family protein/nitrite reductase/ring-hydroxylating ferredoxin subunit
VAYKRILLGTDGSSSAARAAGVAVGLAEAGKAELIVAHAYESRTGAEERLETALVAARQAGLKKVSSELREGSPVDAIAELAEERDAGLIVISGGRGQRYTLGSVAHRLSHHAPCDLLIVSERESHADGTRYARLLIATDGSATADRAARKGFDLAEAIDVPVTLVFVGHPATGELITRDTIAVYAGDVKTDVVLLEGDPAERILDAAETSDADLIMVGNKGMTGAKRFLLGAVPAKVSEYADRDVLIARTVVQAVSELAPGDGGIIERAGEKLAAYVDPGGELHVMSAKCTHLGCTVAWNPGPKTFDCPCHGSRFGPTGEVVNGPAARSLPPA